MELHLQSPICNRLCCLRSKGKNFSLFNDTLLLRVATRWKDTWKWWWIRNDTERSHHGIFKVHVPSDIEEKNTETPSMESWPEHQELNPDDSEFWPHNPKELWPLIFKVHLLEIYAYHFFPLVHIQSLILCLLWRELSVPEKEWCKMEAWCTEWHICANLYWTSLVPKMRKCNNIFRLCMDYCLCALDTHNTWRCITKKFHPSNSSVIINTTNLLAG